MQNIDNTTEGYSLVEVLLSIGLFVFIVSGLAGALLYAQTSNQRVFLRNRGTLLAEEGVEAVRAIRDASFTSLANGTYGLSATNGTCGYSGASENIGSYTRTITIASIDSHTKMVTSTVTWGNGGSARIVTYLSDWRMPSTVPINRKAILAYAGGNTNDSIRFKVYDQSTSVWSAESTTADVDAASSDRVMKVAKLFPSPAKNEQILVTKHRDSNREYIYGQVWNGTTWGNVVLFTSYNATANPDSRNFDGGYLSNGTFMIAVGDRNNIVRFFTWNGTAWSNRKTIDNFGDTPTNIVFKVRPGSNEAMTLVYDDGRKVSTSYYDGKDYTSSNWTDAAVHASSAPASGKQYADFSWSASEPKKGVLVYADSAVDKTISARVFTADGIGGGSWDTAKDSTAQSNVLGALSATARRNADDVLVCNKDVAFQIWCSRTNAAAVWQQPNAYQITASSDIADQYGFGVASETLTGTNTIIAYSNNSAALQYRTFSKNSLSWSSAASIPNVTSTIKSISIFAHPTSDDMAIIFIDGSNNLYSVLWDGSSHAPFTSPASKSVVLQANAGSGTTQWYAFSWDQY